MKTNNKTIQNAIENLYNEWKWQVKSNHNSEWWEDEDWQKIDSALDKAKSLGKDLENKNQKLLDKISLLKTDYLALESEYFAKLDELERENAELKKDKERLSVLLKRSFDSSPRGSVSTTMNQSTQ